jgi:hypothetical protein
MMPAIHHLNARLKSNRKAPARARLLVSYWAKHSINLREIFQDSKATRALLHNKFQHARLQTTKAGGQRLASGRYVWLVSDKRQSGSNHLTVAQSVLRIESHLSYIILTKKIKAKKSVPKLLNKSILKKQPKRHVRTIRELS